ncbi:hypothetical protein EGR_08873 [Echinococcus granulosus]|uniref:Uncharacterized protein n=1 Tax=Echinococcus granulosus TaxID=6210 RepID=W6U508_ECHGR|nr:hypothetical protein EGR_08873 [Echinococcus granulosus]EUB56258.1 hypothetical protein EGR_08873 [Echinococcus granulosus]
MSDDHEDAGDGGGLITITTDGMEALNTNGTKEIVPPDSPKKGDLYVLSTTVAPDGGMEIRRTLVDAGERTDLCTDSDDTIVAPGQESSLHLEAPPSPPEENRILNNQEVEETQRAEIQLSLPEVPPTTEKDEVKTEPKEVIEEHEIEIQKDQVDDKKEDRKSEAQEVSEEPRSVSLRDEQMHDNEELKAEIQKVIDECAAAIEEQQTEVNTGSEDEAAEGIKEHKMEVQEALHKEDEERAVHEAKGVIEEQKLEVQELQQTTADEKAKAESNEVAEEHKLEIKEVDQKQKEEPVKVEPNKEKKPSTTKVKRTMTLPAASRFTLPWQKKHVEDDSGATQESKAHKKSAKTEATTAKPPTTGASKPISGVMRNLKKGFKFKLGGSSRSGEDSAPGRIPQISGSRPSPRIVSSLNITPTHQEVVATEPLDSLHRVSSAFLRLSVGGERVSTDSLSSSSSPILLVSTMLGSLRFLKENVTTEAQASIDGYCLCEHYQEFNEYDHQGKMKANGVGGDGGLLTYESREIQAPLESPTTCRRKELDSILSAMPPSPTPSTESLHKVGEAGGSPHIYDNLPAEQQNGKSPNTPAEEEICPSVATKPVLTTIAQAINEKKARDMMESIKSERANGAVVANDLKPPRPPPAKNEQSNSTKASPRNLPPPPRPSAPPRVLEKSYTMAASSPPPLSDVEVISPVSAPSPVHSAPVQMRSDYTNATTSLDRKKLYRSKEETRAAKMTTLSRPMTIHETSFTVKRKLNESQHRSLDEGSQPPKSGQKVIFEQKDSFTLPKFLLGSKRKSVPAPVLRPHLANSPTTEGNRASVLKPITASEDNSTPLSPTITSMQCSMPPVRPIATASVCVQTAPLRPKAPVSSIPYGKERPTLLALASKLGEPSEHTQDTAFKEAYFQNLIKPSIKSPQMASSPGNELSLPLLGYQIAEEAKTPDEGKSSIFAFSHSHKLWSMRLEGEESASEKLVNKCLLEYTAACARLKSVDLQGEFAGFHWQCGDLSEAGWFKRGTLAGYSSLEVYHDPSKQLDYVKLPPIQYSVGSIIYPEATIDALLSTWINESHLGTPSTLLLFESPTDTETAFHPALAIIRLSDVLQELTVSENPSCDIHPSIALAVLLSIDQCSSKLSHNLKGGEKAFLNLDPAEITLLCSPANCLVIFRIADSEGDWNVKKVLLELHSDHADSLEATINACMENLSKLVTTKVHLSALLQAIAPPDWIMQAGARSALEKANSAVPSGNED